MIDLITGKRIVKLRESGIELLKIFGILLVVLSHVVQTLGDYVNISYASKNPTVLALGVIRLSGNLGNIILQGINLIISLIIVCHFITVIF